MEKESVTSIVLDQSEKDKLIQSTQAVLAAQRQLQFAQSAAALIGDNAKLTMMVRHQLQGAPEDWEYQETQDDIFLVQKQKLDPEIELALKSAAAAEALAKAAAAEEG